MLRRSVASKFSSHSSVCMNFQGRIPSCSLRQKIFSNGDCHGQGTPCRWARMALGCSCGGRTLGSRMKSLVWHWSDRGEGAAAWPMGYLGTTSVAGKLLLPRWECWQNYSYTFGWLSQQWCCGDCLVKLAGRSCQCSVSHPCMLVNFHYLGSDAAVKYLVVSCVVVHVAVHWSFILLFCSSLAPPRLSFH